MSSKTDKIKYQLCRVASCFNHVIDLNLENVNFFKISDEKDFSGSHEN
jgi:hypothetical protein